MCHKAVQKDGHAKGEEGKEDWTGMSECRQVLLEIVAVLPVRHTARACTYFIAIFNSSFVSGPALVIGRIPASARLTR